MKKSIVAAVLSGVLAGGILVSAGSIMADTTETSLETKSAVVEMKRGGGGMRGHGDMGSGFMGKGQEGLETILADLVADGTITQAKADKISDFITQKVEDMKAQREEMKNMTQEEREAIKDESKNKKGDILTELVDEEIISQAEADAIQENLEAQREEMAATQKKAIEEKYNKLVEEGIISQDKADQLLELMEEKMDEMKAQREELKNMTMEERKEAAGEKQDKKGGYLVDAVEAGIITQDEADAIQQYEQKEMEAKREAMMDEQFAKLVAEGVISQEQADKMKEFQKTKVDERQAQMDELKDMTDAERKAFFEEKKDTVKGINMLDEMVEEGIISQDQADKLAEKMPMPGRFGQRNCDILSEEQE